MSKYFVSYYWKTFLRRGYGMMVLEAESMETVDGLLAVQKRIVEINGFAKCVILNFKNLGENVV